MPWYDYQCDTCTEIFEEEHPMDFSGVVLCPVCDSGNAHKVFFSLPALRVRWRDPRSSSDVSGLIPRYMHAVKRPRRRRPTATADELEGFTDDVPTGHAQASLHN